MGSVIKNGGGRWRVSYMNAQGKRKILYLPKMPKRDAERINMFVEKLVNAQITKHPIDGETARWVADIGDHLATKLAHHKLVSPRSAATLEDFIDTYIDGRTDLKPRTRIKFNATKDYLINYFGADRMLREITPGDADDWRIHLIGKKLSENTVRKHVQIAKQFFNAASRKGLIDASPFADLKSTTLANPDGFTSCLAKRPKQYLMPVQILNGGSSLL